MYCYKFGLEGEIPHTLWATELKFKISHNQLHLVLNGSAKYKSFPQKVSEFSEEKGIPAAATEFELSTTTVERIIDGYKDQD